jgi:Mycotoxin biosynthesis protein UstYa
MIRQSLLCHGDISLLYWWNHNYSYVDEGGVRHYTEEYLQKSPEERAVGTFAMWDTPVQCRDLEAINTWAKERQINDDKYGGQEID